MKIIDTLRNKFRDSVGESSGSAGNEEQGGIRKPSPIKSFYSNGMFIGENGDYWLYFKFPEDVKVDWTKSYRDSADNQSFLTNIMDNIAGALRDSGTSTKRDERVKFHIPIVRETTNEIQKYDDITPAQYDFLDRMGGYSHPIWHAYLGLQLKMGDINANIPDLAGKVRNYIDFMFNSDDIDYQLYRQSIESYTSICIENGMRPLDFSYHPEDFDRLTAWFGESDVHYSERKELTSTIIKVPDHGRSIFVSEEYGEISFSAISPKETRDAFVKDPFDPVSTRFGETLMRPSLGVVHINIRGEIRSPDATSNVFDDKLTKTDNKVAGQEVDKTSVGDRKKAAKSYSEADIASTMSAVLQHAWLDNVEMVVATEVNEHPSALPGAMDKHNMNVSPITARQHTALCSTIPCYPNPIFKVPKGNESRNPNVNNFYAGVLSLSGLFRSTRPAADRGVLIGVSDAGYEYKEIFTEVDAPGKYGAKPTVLITGDTGSGKAMSLSTPIPTPEGWKELGDIHKGDKVFSVDGSYTEVEYESEVFNNHDCYRVITSDGQNHIFDRDHQHVVALSGGGHKIADEMKEIKPHLDRFKEYAETVKDRKTPAEIFEILKQFGANKGIWNNIETLIGTLDFMEIPKEERVLSIDDYDEFEAESYDLSQVANALLLRLGEFLSPEKYGFNEGQVFVRLSTKELEALLHATDCGYTFGLPETKPVEFDPSLSSSSSESGAYFYGYLKNDRIDSIPREMLEEVQKYTNSDIYYGPLSHRVSFVKGVMDSNWHRDTDGSYHAMNNAVAEMTTSVLRSLGRNVEYHNNDTSFRLLEGPVEISDIIPEATTQTKCLQVAHKSRTFLAGDYMATSNTVQILMMLAQAVYLGHQVVMLNPKPQSTLKPFFDLLDGYTINMSTAYLKENPGLLDPMFYINDRERVARILSDMVIKAMGMNTDNSVSSNRSMEAVRAEILERAKHPSNMCSYDIIFGNRRANPQTPRLTNDDIVDYINDKMKTSPFWRAAISQNPEAQSTFAEKLRSGKPLLVEWDNSIVLPSSGQSPDKYTPDENDGVQSVVNLFAYAADIIGNSRSGGILAIDEAYILQTSPEAMNLVRTAGRTWRSANITLLLATQHLKDFLGEDNPHNIASHVRMYLFLAVSREDKQELDIFFDVTELPRDETNVGYITNAGMKNAMKGKAAKTIPNGYLVDKTYEWSGGVILGPWPFRELTAATSKESEKTREDQIDQMESYSATLDSYRNNEYSSISDEQDRLEDR